MDEITVDAVVETIELFEKDGRAWLELDPENGVVHCYSTHQSDNGTPAHVFHGRSRRWRIPMLRADSANALMEKIKPLALRIARGFSVRWNGSNHIGVLNGDAFDAESDITAECHAAAFDDADMCHVLDADDWFGPNGYSQTARELGVTAASTDAELDAIAEAQEAAPGEVDELTGTRRYLETLRDWCRDRAEEDATALEQIKENAKADAEGWIQENPLGGDCSLVDDHAGTDEENAAYASVVVPMVHAHQTRCGAMEAAIIRAGTCDANLHHASEKSGGAFTFDHARVYRDALDDESQAAELAQMSDDERDPFSNRNHGRLL